MSPKPPEAPTDVPGATPAFGTLPGVGPVVSTATFATAEALQQITLQAPDRQLAAGNWRETMAPLLERRTGPRHVEITATTAPYRHPAPVAPPPLATLSQPEPQPTPTLPASDHEIAFAPIHHLAHWLLNRALTSERLTEIYLARIARYDPQLRAVITLMPTQALAQARAADREIAAGRYRGPLHGIPWGAKDLLDTANTPTTFGAEPFRNRIPTTDAAVVRLLAEAGAILLAKLSLGALALNDVWFGGQTMNPWLPEEGSSGSSAGSGAAVAAGLVAFAIGSETEGSIISPSMRCGLAGLRPTFGRVPRTGAMTLCWSLDKLGPMCRSVADTALVLEAITAHDPADPDSVPTPPTLLSASPTPVHNPVPLRIGFVETWLHQPPATEVDREALATLARLGHKLVPVTLPDWPYASLNAILFAEAAAAFEDLTLSHAVDQLKMQVPDAWPNFFRQARFLSAVDLVQATRFRTLAAAQMARFFTEVDVLLIPSLREETLILANFTGHPSLTLRAGFVHVTQARSDWAPDPAHPLPTFEPPRRVPYGITIIARHFDESTLCRLGQTLEHAFNVAHELPPAFSA